MTQPQVLILRAPGTNCDQETAFAFSRAGANPIQVHINQLVSNPKFLTQSQILCLPGGFSYGDDIAAGRILANQLKLRLADAMAEFRDQGKLILGICNGFQILIKSGFLIPSDAAGLPATLTWNDSGHFIDTWVHLNVDQQKSVFLKGIERMYLPIAHAEGKFVPRDAATLSRLADNHQLALTYCRCDGSSDSLAAPDNPNGSIGNVAGLSDETGRILGMMPHPERHVVATHHPQWTRLGLSDRPDGLAIFQNAVNYFA